MIITLKGCTATAFIGGLDFFSVKRGTVSGADVTISTSTINKDAATSTSAREIATVALKSNYKNLVVTVTMGGTTVNWYAGGKVTIPANTAVTGDIKISASATAVVPEGPVAPTMYTFTINPTPATATVTLTASGYSQSGKSITVPANTVVTWKVSASGYTEQKGTHTVTKTETKNVTLDATSIENQIDLGTINDRQWIKFENGENQSLNAWKSTADYIAIPDGVTSIHSDDITAFRNNGANTTPYAFYDVDKKYISGVDMETIPEDTTGVSNTGAWRNSLTYDVPENAAYVRICWTTGGYRHMTTGVSAALTSPIVQWVY